MLMTSFFYCVCSRQTLVVGCPLCARERGRVYVYAPSQADGVSANMCVYVCVFPQTDF